MLQLKQWRVLSRAIQRLLLSKMMGPQLKPNTAEPYLVKAVQGVAKSQVTVDEKVQPKQRFGEDSWFISSTAQADVLGVADGVGSWRDMGVDAGLFAKELMYWCAICAERPQFEAQKLKELLVQSYSKLREQKEPVLGSSTACLVALKRDNCTLYTANLGDSGFMVLRNGKVLQRSEEQMHGFNTPYQLAMPPEERQATVHCDKPEQAVCSQMAMQQGDVLLVATDGLFDNVPESMLVKMLSELQGVDQADRLQQCANALVNMAHDLSLSAHYQSPFALKARQNNMLYAGGGKPDDITVIVSSVAMQKDAT